MSAKPLGLLIALLLLAAPGARAAATTNDGHDPATSRRALAALWERTTTLATLQQGPQQSDEDFLREAAAVIDTFTRTLQAEVCGVFERDDSTARLVLTLLTQGSPAFCLHPRGKPGDGSGLDGLSIHSHVAARPSSARIAQLAGDGQPVRFLGGRFSMADIAAGPGYLVHEGRVWYQHGLGTQRFVARVEADRVEPVPQYVASTAEATAAAVGPRSDWRDDGWSITGGDS